MTQGEILGVHHVKVPVTRAVAGYDPFAILVQGRDDIETWAARLDDLGIGRSPVTEATIGWLMSFKDPDGLELRFYTADRHAGTENLSQGDAMSGAVEVVREVFSRLGQGAWPPPA